MRLIFMAVFYLILPFDFLPESVVGVVGFIDDLLIFMILASYVVTIVAVQYYRAHHWGKTKKLTLNEWKKWYFLDEWVYDTI